MPAPDRQEMGGPKEEQKRTSTESSRTNASASSMRPTKGPRPQLSSMDSMASTVVGSEAALSPTIDAGDRVFPIRSVVARDPNPTPASRVERPGGDGYFQTPRRFSANPGSAQTSTSNTPARQRQESTATSSSGMPEVEEQNKGDTPAKRSVSLSRDEEDNTTKFRQPAVVFSEIAGGKAEDERGRSDGASSYQAASTKSMRDNIDDNGTGLLTARFKHVVSEDGHMIITGRDGETLQRCEDEPIHIPGAVQGFGLLIALEEEAEGKLVVRVVSENSQRILGYTPRQLFGLESFTDLLSEEQADNLLDHVDFIRDEDADVMANGPEVFTISIRSPSRRSQKLWCAMHVNPHHSHLIICEFELEDDPHCPLVPPGDGTPEPPEDTLSSDPTPQEFAESTQNISKPLRVLRSARKRKGEAAAMEVFNIMSQVQQQLNDAPNLDRFLKILCGVVKELTGFHRVMIYQFDKAWNGRVVTELVDPRATKDLYHGLNFPASDIPQQARELYKLSRVRLLWDRDQETARLVCRTAADLETPLDMTYCYLRAMSPIHIKYLANMAVRSSMSLSICAFDELWGLIACHTYGSKGMRISFAIRKMCRLVGDAASRNIERLSYAARLQARKLINTAPSSQAPSGYIIASSEDLLKLFDADFGLLSIRDETKILGHLEQSQEALALVEYLRMRQITNVTTSQDLKEDFPDLHYPQGFKKIAGLLLVPLSGGGQDFIVFFRKGQLKEVKWAGNPYEKYIKSGTEGYLEPRKSFKTWSETVVGKCREWTEEEVETAAVLCLVYGKFIEVWRQKEAALQNSQLTRLLLANSAHEVRTPLNAIINYLEIALEGQLDQETRENLSKSHSASRSLVYVINDLLDLTKTEEGVGLIKDEPFELHAALAEATENFNGDAKRKGIEYMVLEHPGLPKLVIGDQRKIRQAIANVTANAIQNTSSGSVTVDVYVASRADRQVDIECTVTDTGAGLSPDRLDALFRELEQVETEGDPLAGMPGHDPDQKTLEGRKPTEKKILGLGLAVVARIIKNMNGQMRLKSDEGKGSRFVLSFPFQLPDSEASNDANSTAPDSTNGSVTPHAELEENPTDHAGEVTLIERDTGRRLSMEMKNSITRKTSSDSLASMGSNGSFGSSIKSARSNASQASQRSEADRLIDAIQEPHMVGSSSSHRPGSSSGRPRLSQRRSTTRDGQAQDSSRRRSKSMEVAAVPEHLREIRVGPAGQAQIPDQRTPVKSIRIPDDFDSVAPSPTSAGGFSSVGSIKESNTNSPGDRSPDNKHFNVLIAEDDPVNSRIIQKRLSKLGHDPHLTVNGEECATIYGEKTGHFDVVLMDMQMPIVDGLTSTKMIRSFEKSHPTHILSTRASLNGRVPIIAVSASLEERERKKYIDAGFDGWILKPISFDRLSDIMLGIVDPAVRKKNLYRTGSWERGGWFEEGQKDIFAANTKPEGEVPFPNPHKEVKIAAAAEDPAVKEEDSSTQSKEQERLLAVQAQQRQEEGNSTAEEPDGRKGDGHQNDEHMVDGEKSES